MERLTREKEKLEEENRVEQWHAAVLCGLVEDFYTLLISHKSPRELEPDVLSMAFSK